MAGILELPRFWLAATCPLHSGVFFFSLKLSSSVLITKSINPIYVAE